MSLSSLDVLIDKAKESKDMHRVAIAGAEDASVIRAAIQAMEMGLTTPVFIGKSEEIKRILHREGVSENGIPIVDGGGDESPSAIAVRLVLSGEASFLMKGMVTTKELLSEVVNKKRGIAGAGLLSHLAVFEIPARKKLLAVTDAAMNISPDRSEKKQIILNAVRAYHKLGIKTPNVALLAAVEKVNPKIGATEDAHILSEEHMSHPFENCNIEGPLALDGAVSEEAARIKGISGGVAGNADILVVPELNAGNILYKSIIYLAGASTAGVILGARQPIILTSRSDSPKSKLYSIALAKCLC